MPSGTQGKMRPAVPLADLIPNLTTAEWIQVASTAIPGIAASAAVLAVVVNIRNERRRTQPIVIAHEWSSRRFSASQSPAAWVVEAYLTSEGAGPAFNVRFGVEFNGVRYPYRLRPEDPESGAIQRVLAPRERRPPVDSWPILVDSLTLWGRAAESKQPGDLDAKRTYWARYENAQRETWETTNPGDRTARLAIRRIKRVARHEQRERRLRERAAQHDKDWERAALAELRAGMTGDDTPLEGGDP